MIEKEKFILNKIQRREYTLLPTSIAIGIVFEIPICGNLEEDGFERSFIYLPKGSSIKKHPHVSEIEKYTLVKGSLKIEGEPVSSDICDLGCSHGIDTVDTDTIVETCKISDKYLLCGYQKNMDDLFEFFSKDNYLDEYNAKSKTYIK